MRRPTAPVADPAGGNALEVSLVNDVRELARVAGAVDAFCAGHNLGTRLSYAVDMALDEVLGYCIAHAYDDEDPHPIEVAVYLDPDEIVVLIVTDGVDLSMRRPFSDGRESILDEERLEELGLFLVHQVMDTVTCERQQDCNVVVMTKRRPSAPGASP